MTKHDYAQHCTPRKTRPFTLETAWNVGVGLAIVLMLAYLLIGMARGIVW